MTTIGDVVKWCLELKKSGELFTDWDEVSLTLEIEKRSELKELLIHEVNDEIVGIIIFKVNKEKHEIFVENLVSHHKGTCGVFLVSMINLYGKQILTDGDWVIYGKRGGKFPSRTCGRKFKITPNLGLKALKF